MKPIMIHVAAQFKVFCKAALIMVLGLMILVGSVGNVDAIASPSSELKDKAAQVVDDIAAGSSKRIEGKAQQDIGATKKTLGQAGKKLEGSADQIAGRAKQDIGRTQQATEKARSKVAKKSDNIVDKIKDAFN